MTSKKEQETYFQKYVWNLNGAMWVCGVLAVACLIAGFVEWYFAHSKLDANPKVEDLGNYGSYLQGTVASLWALAGVLLIVVAFFGQQKQLREQEKQFEQQHKSMRRENFERSFFQLLGLHSAIASNARYVFRPGHSPGQPAHPPKIYEGSECFEHLCVFLTQHFTNQKKPTDKEPVVNVYMAFYHSYQGDLSHYFRNLYHVIRFVKDSDIEPRRRYTSLVRAQLSAYELVLLFYDGISPYGEKFKPLIEEFGLLEHLNVKLLLHESHKDFYNASAYV